jgi:hypothetical protein
MRCGKLKPQVTSPFPRRVFHPVVLTITLVVAVWLVAARPNYQDEGFLTLAAFALLLEVPCAFWANGVSRRVTASQSKTLGILSFALLIPFALYGFLFGPFLSLSGDDMPARVFGLIAFVSGVAVLCGAAILHRKAML